MTLKEYQIISKALEDLGKHINEKLDELVDNVRLDIEAKDQVDLDLQEQKEHNEAIH